MTASRVIKQGLFQGLDIDKRPFHEGSKVPQTNGDMCPSDRILSGGLGSSEGPVWLRHSR